MSKGSPRVTQRSQLRFHLRWGWWSLLVFACAGLCLEALHGFKVAWYLDASSETRRLMFRLGHAHGALMGLVHIAFAATLAVTETRPRSASVASRALAVGSVLLPLGFLLGGLGAQGGDPSAAIVLVPLGALSLLLAFMAAGLSLRDAPRDDARPQGNETQRGRK